MEPVSGLVLEIAAAVIKLLVVVPLIALYREEGWEEIGRTEFAFWLAGYLFAWLVLALFVVLLTETGRFVFVIVWPGLFVAGIAVYSMFHFFEAVAQRARDAGLGKGIAWLAAVPPLNLALYVVLLIMPGVTPRRGSVCPTRLSAALLHLARDALRRIVQP